MSFAPRWYQVHAVGRALEEFRENDSTLIVQPTGTGKTVVFSLLINDWRDGRVLVLAHRQELIAQAAEKIEAITGTAPDIEMADQRAHEGIFGQRRVVLSSVQTFLKRMHRFDPEQFGLLILDEAHHYIADGWLKAVAYMRRNPRLKVLGVTATPDRADQAAMGRLFDSVAFNYTLPEAVRDGFLVRFVQTSVRIESLDFSSLRTTAGDFNQADLAKLMEYEAPMQSLALATLDRAKWRRALVFCVSVAQAERTAEIFNRYRPGSARWVCGKTHTDQRQQSVRDFKANAFQFLCNVGVFTEGYDDPSLGMAVMGRPTKSRALFAQMAGRIARPEEGVLDGLEDADARRRAIAGSGKPVAELLDLVGNSGRHKLVTLADILGGDYDAPTRERAAREAAEESATGTPVDVGDKLAQIVQERELREAQSQHGRREIQAKLQYTAVEIDPCEVFEIEPPRERRWEKGLPPTDAQLDALRRRGIPTKGLNRAKANRLLDEAKSRRAAGMCSWRQARILAQRGLPTNVTEAQAETQIRDIALREGWRTEAPGVTHDHV